MRAVLIIVLILAASPALAGNTVDAFFTPPNAAAARDPVWRALHPQPTSSKLTQEDIKGRWSIRRPDADLNVITLEDVLSVSPDQMRDPHGAPARRVQLRANTEKLLNQINNQFDELAKWDIEHAAKEKAAEEYRAYLMDKYAGKPYAIQPTDISRLLSRNTPHL